MKKLITASVLWVGVAAIGALACTVPGASAPASGRSNTAAVQVATAQPAAPVTARSAGAAAQPIVGDLTVHGVTRQETFDATLTMESATRLSGQAQTTIKYADYGINVPRVPIVSGVAETVRIEMDFVAPSA